MLMLLKRHQVHALLAAGHDQMEVAGVAGVSVQSGRSRPNPRSSTSNDRQERTQCGIGRPSKVAPFRALVQARLDGYEGGKSAIYELIAELRPHAAQLTMRFEGLPGEFSQHDFAEVRITYVDGSCEVAWVLLLAAEVLTLGGRRCGTQQGRRGRPFRGVRRGTAVRGVRPSQDGDPKVSQERPSRATAEVPELRRQQEW